MNYTTAAGLVVTDRRSHHRAREVPQVDPRTHDPNPNAPSSVGPATRAGDVMGASAMGGWHAEAWDGWPPDWATPFYGDDYSGFGYGRDPVTGKLSTAMTCADLNSRQLASFPIYGLRGSAPVGLPGWATNPEPSLYASWVDLMHAVVNCLELRGEAFTYATGRYAESAGGYPARFVVLNPDAVQVEWIDAGLEYLVDGNPVDPRDICHLKYQSWPGRLHGIGPLEWASRSLATAGALERYASSLANRGGVPWAVLKSQRNIDKGQATDAQTAWVTARARADGAPAVIGNAFELQPLTISPRDMALLELREFDERRICAAFGVPGYLVNVAMADGLTYANASQLFAHHWTATLRPLADLIAKAWSTWLLPAGTTLEFNPDRYVQPPFAERAGAYATLYNLVDPATGRRAMELDEIRAAERLGDSAQAQTLLGS